MKLNIKNRLLDFINNEFIDRTNGGIFAALNRDRYDVITEDKLLIDTALALITFSYNGYTDEVSKLVTDIELFKDSTSEGYYEILDTTSVPHAAGRVKTVSTQILAGYGLYCAGELLRDTKLKSKGDNLISFALNKCLDNGKASRFDGNWDNVLDKRQSIKTLSLIVYISIKVLGIEQVSEELIEGLFRYADLENGGVYSYLDQLNNPEKLLGKKLSDMSLVCICLNEVYEVKKERKYIELVYNIISFIDKNFHHPLSGGFWNKSNSKGLVSVDAISAYYNNDESPFPIKSMKDHALFLIALKNIPEIDNDHGLIRKLKSEVLLELTTFIDSRNGGISEGQGNWFSTPTNPTVPLARHVMVPPHTVGSFAVGNTYYVPLHQKQATTQLLGILAFDNENAILENKISNIDYNVKPFNRDLHYITTGSLTESYIDTKKYLKWLNKTKSGLSYGLTPYKSPLGFRSDKSPQNFSAFHVVSDLFVLGEEISNKDELLSCMYSCQNEDGGFGEHPSLLSEVFTTYCVAITAYILNNNEYDIYKCTQFIKSAQNEDGGFGNAPGYPTDMWHTNLAILTLHALGADPLYKEKAIQYILNCRNQDGGYSLNPGGYSELYSTFKAIDSLVVLGVDIPKKDETINWIKSCQDDCGGFIYQKGKPVSFVASYHAIAALYLLGELPNKLEQCKKWMGDHQVKDGGFSAAIGGPSNTTDESFIAIQASYMLEKKLNPYWAAIVT